MAKPLNFLTHRGLCLAALIGLATGCTSLSTDYPVPRSDESGDRRKALDERIKLAGEKALFIGEESFRFDLNAQERRLARAIVQLVPYDVNARRSHGKGVGLLLTGSDDQHFLLTAAHILYHPRTRKRRAQDLMLFGAHPDSPPHILSGQNLPPRFISMMPFLTQMDDILLIPIETMPGVNAFPLSTLITLELDRKPLIGAAATLSAVSCDYLSEDFPTACFAQNFRELEARRINLYSAVTSDLDVYPGLSGSPIVALTDDHISVLGVIISASRKTDCPDYALPDCYALIGPMTDDVMDRTREIEPLTVREEFRDALPEGRKDLRAGWWQDY